MSEVGPNTGGKSNRSCCAVLTTCLFLGALISLSDALIITLYGVLREGMSLRILEPIAVKMFIIAVLYVVLWLLLLYSIGRMPKLDMEAISVSLGVSMIIVYVMGMMYNMSVRPSFPRSLRIFVFICEGLLMITLLFSWAVYSATKAVLHSKRRALAGAVCLAVPLLIAETILVLWVNNLFGPLPTRLGLLWSRLFTVPGLVTNTAYIVCIVVTLVVFVRLKHSRVPARVLQVFALFVFAGSVLALMFRPDQIRISKVSARTDNPVKHVILIVIDTLRSDALSCYGGQRIFTPNIDQLAADGILFKKTFAPAPWTVPSVASIMTGLSPLVHMAKHKGEVPPDTLSTLAEYMRDAGYLTHAIVSNPVLVHRNFQQGFMSYNSFPKRGDFSPLGKVLSRWFPRRFEGSASTSDLTRLAIDWLESNADNDFFLWIHYYDPHTPYEPPEEYLPKGRQPAQGIGKRFGFSSVPSVRGGYLMPTLEQREWIRTLYDSEVRYVDENIGLLLDHLKKLKIYDDTLIVLTSDHGEEFWEHGGYEHGHTLYNELLSVPLMIKPVRSSSKGIVVRPVSTESITPTVLDLCKIEYKQNYMSHGSLVPAWSTNSEVDNVDSIVATGMLYYEEKEAVIFDGQKDIRFLVTDWEEFYDLAEDPGERFNIAHTSRAKLEKAREILNKHHQTAEGLKRHYLIEKAKEVELDADTMQRLKSLGYVK